MTDDRADREHDGEVAYLIMDVDAAGGLTEGYELKLNSYDLGVDIELADALTEEGRFDETRDAIADGAAVAERIGDARLTARTQIATSALDLVLTELAGSERAIADAVEAALRRLPHLEVLRDGDAVVAEARIGGDAGDFLAAGRDEVAFFGGGGGDVVLQRVARQRGG